MGPQSEPMGNALGVHCARRTVTLLDPLGRFPYSDWSPLIEEVRYGSVAQTKCGYVLTSV